MAEQPPRAETRDEFERIVDAAIEIADADGLAAVSMSSVAGRLGFTTMSLYRYVSAKDDLLVLMTEEGVGPPPVTTPIDDDWRTGLQRWLAALSDAYAAHPWLLDIPIIGIPVTPNNLAWLDWGLRILRSPPLTPDEALSIVLMLSGMGRWEATISRATAGPDRAASKSCSANW